MQSTRRARRCARSQLRRALRLPADRARLRRRARVAHLRRHLGGDEGTDLARLVAAAVSFRRRRFSVHPIKRNVSPKMKKVIVITGASRGIGAATARLAAARGYAVCVNYLKKQAAASAVVDDIESAGGQAIAVAADVAAETEVVNLFR